MLLSGAQWKDERGNRHELKYGKFHFKMWKTLFTVKEIKLRAVSPWQIMESPSLELFRTQMDVAVSNLLLLTLLWAGQSDKGSPQVLQDLLPFYFKAVTPPVRSIQNTGLHVENSAAGIYQ